MMISRILFFFLIFIPFWVNGQKGFNFHGMNTGTGLSYRDFYILFDRNTSKLNETNRTKLVKILKDLDSIKSGYAYSGLWINCTISNDNRTSHKIQKKRCSNVVKFLLNSKFSDDFNYKIFFIETFLPIEEKENSYVQIYYD